MHIQENNPSILLMIHVLEVYSFIPSLSNFLETQICISLFFQGFLFAISDLKSVLETHIK